MPSLTTYKLLKQEHNARRGEFKTVHGTVQTPAFQNVATAGAIKGGLWPPQKPPEGRFALRAASGSGTDV